jgi:L-alanine-DL-glutamate epimerase-like enolase superfamily enzyme
MPVYQLLGGASRDSIRIYNTCYDWLDFMTEPVQLARDLLDSGIRAMKIWPFDGVARETGGQFLTPEHMRKGMEPIRRIREELGDSMDLAIEFHGYWNLPCAIKIAKECEPYSPLWLEEMLPQDNMAAYRELAQSTPIPLCLSERLMTRWGFREVLENRAARIIMPDICWCGGLSEARKIATHAETYYLPVAPHNCGGPVLHAASAHLAANTTNLYILETVRKHYLEEYRGLLDGYPLLHNGMLRLPRGPGLGVALKEELFKSAGVKVQRHLKS